MSRDMAETVWLWTFSALPPRSAFGTIELVSFGGLPVTSLDLSRLFQTPFYQSRGRRIDIPNMAMGSQGSQDKFNLRSFVRIVLQLSMVE